MTKDRKKNQSKETVICAQKKNNVACINCHMLRRYCTQFQWFHRYLVKYTCQTKRNNLNRHVYRSCCSSHFLLRSFALYFFVLSFRLNVQTDMMPRKFILFFLFMFFIFFLLFFFLLANMRSSINKLNSTANAEDENILCIVFLSLLMLLINSIHPGLHL